MRIRKLLLSLVVLLAFSALARAQAGNTVLLRFVGAPTGTCAPIMVAVNNATGEMFDCLSNAWHSVGGSGGGGTVTSVGQTFTGGLISVAGSPVTTSGTLALTVAGTSGGIPYFDSATSWLSSAALTSNSPIMGGGAGAAPKTATFLTTNGTTTLNVGVAGGGNGILGLCGNTSGCATLTAPAVAGTITNPILISNSLQFPSGTVLGWNGDLGISRNSAGQTAFGNGTAGSQSAFLLANGIQAGPTVDVNFNANGMSLGSTAVIAFGTSSGSSSSKDIGGSRISAGIWGFGSGAQGSTVGKVQASAYISAGTKFTLSTNGCSATTTLGGGSAGSFVSGTTGTCTVTILMGDSATAPTGWHCTFSDHTTSANFLSQTGAADTTHCSMTGTTVSGDLITFAATGY